MDFSCYSCDYSEFKGKKSNVLCKRPLKIENRLSKIPLEKANQNCCCHSKRDQMKSKGEIIDDGLFTISLSRLKEIENYIFGDSTDL